MRPGATNRRIKPRSVASAAGGKRKLVRTPSGPDEDECAGASPNQVSRMGHRPSSAVRLNRSWIRRAQTTPQWSRNQSQSRSRFVPRRG